MGAGGSFFAFGTAGNDPLLLLGITPMVSSWMGVPTMGEIATRLLDCSTSIRRWLTCLSMSKSGKYDRVIVSYGIPIESST